MHQASLSPLSLSALLCISLSCLPDWEFMEDKAFSPIPLSAPPSAPTPETHECKHFSCYLYLNICHKSPLSSFHQALLMRPKALSTCCPPTPDHGQAYNHLVDSIYFQPALPTSPLLPHS